MSSVLRPAIILCSLLAALLLSGEAGALPSAPDGPRSTRLDGEGRGGRVAPTLVAAARRRRYGSKKPKAAPKPRPKPEPAPEPAPMPAKAGGGTDPGGAAPGPDNLQRGGRVEFDGRLVQGQTAKSGAIYLFARQRTDLKSMVREREHYRREILRTVYPDWVK